MKKAKQKTLFDTWNNKSNNSNQQTRTSSVIDLCDEDDALLTLALEQSLKETHGRPDDAWSPSVNSPARPRSPIPSTSFSGFQSKASTSNWSSNAPSRTTLFSSISSANNRPADSRNSSLINVGASTSHGSASTSHGKML